MNGLPFVITARSPKVWPLLINSHSFVCIYYPIKSQGQLPSDWIVCMNGHTFGLLAVTHFSIKLRINIPCFFFFRICKLPLLLHDLCNAYKFLNTKVISILNFTQLMHNSMWENIKYRGTVMLLCRSQLEFGLTLGLRTVNKKSSVFDFILYYNNINNSHSPSK